MDKLELDVVQLRTTLDGAWVVINGFLILFMQCGFAVLEAGNGRIHNVASIIIKNFSDFTVVSVLYCIIGYSIAFPRTYQSPVESLFSFHWNDLAALSNLSHFFFQVAFANTAATSCLLERTRYISYIIFSAFMGSIVYPIASHWIWSDKGFLSITNVYVSSIFISPGAVDFAGAGPVHIVGGMVGLVGCFWVGPRIHFYDQITKKPQRIRGHSAVLRAIGTMFLWFGFYGFNMGSTAGLSNGKYKVAGLIAVNTTISASAAGITAFAFARLVHRKVDLDTLLNGFLAGLVSITAGCAYIEPYGALVIGILSGIIFTVLDEALFHKGIDDPCGAIAVHLGGGIWGVISAGLLSNSDTVKGAFFGNPRQLWIQIVEVVVLLLWATICSVMGFFIIDKTLGMRVGKLDEEEGVDVKIGAQAYPELNDVEKMMNEVVGLEKLLNRPNSRMLWLFHAYLQREFSSDSLDLLISIKAFNKEMQNLHNTDEMKNKLDKDKLTERFKKTVSLYISNEEGLAVRISERQRTKILKALEENGPPPANIFDKLEEELTESLKSAYKRFCRDYEKAMIERRKKEARSQENIDGARRRDQMFWKMSLNSSMGTTSKGSTAETSTDSVPKYVVDESGRVIWRMFNKKIPVEKESIEKKENI